MIPWFQNLEKEFTFLLKKLQRSLIMKDRHKGTSPTILVSSNSVLSFMGSETTKQDTSVFCHTHSQSVVLLVCKRNKLMSHIILWRASETINRLIWICVCLQRACSLFTKQYSLLTIHWYTSSQVIGTVRAGLYSDIICFIPPPFVTLMTLLQDASMLFHSKSNSAMILKSH